MEKSNASQKEQRLFICSIETILADTKEFMDHSISYNKGGTCFFITQDEKDDEIITMYIRKKHC